MQLSGHCTSLSSRTVMGDAPRVRDVRGMSILSIMSILRLDRIGVLPHQERDLLVHGHSAEQGSRHGQWPDSVFVFRRRAWSVAFWGNPVCRSVTAVIAISEDARHTAVELTRSPVPAVDRRSCAGSPVGLAQRCGTVQGPRVVTAGSIFGRAIRALGASRRRPRRGSRMRELRQLSPAFAGASTGFSRSSPA